MTAILQKAQAQTQSNVNADVLQFLSWAATEAKTVGKDEGQIFDTAATKLSELVQSGQSWSQAWGTVRAEFDASQLNEWQKLQFDAVTELAAALHQVNTILQGFLALLP